MLSKRCSRDRRGARRVSRVPERDRRGATPSRRRSRCTSSPMTCVSVALYIALIALDHSRVPRRKLEPTYGENINFPLRLFFTHNVLNMTVQSNVKSSQITAALISAGARAHSEQVCKTCGSPSRLTRVRSRDVVKCASLVSRLKKIDTPTKRWIGTRISQ